MLPEKYAFDLDAYVTGLINTAISGIPTLYSSGEQVYSGTVTQTASVASSGTPAHAYFWSRVGNSVSAQFMLTWTVGGTGMTSVSFPLPNTMPVPKNWNGQSGTNDVLQWNTGVFMNSLTQIGAIGPRVTLKNSSGTATVTVTGSSTNTVVKVFANLNYICT